MTNFPNRPKLIGFKKRKTLLIMKFSVPQCSGVRHEESSDIL